MFNYMLGRAAFKVSQPHRRFRCSVHDPHAAVVPPVSGSVADTDSGVFGQWVAHEVIAVPTVDDDGVASHVAGGVRGEEDRNVGHVVGCPEPAEGDPLRERRPPDHVQ